MTSRIFINGRFLTQQITGVQAFARSICQELSGVCEFKLLVPENASLIDPIFPDRIIFTGKLNGHLWEQIHLPTFLRKYPEARLLNLCNTGPAFRHNQVCTIHDLAVLRNPEWFNPLFSKFYSWLLPRIAKNSRAVLTVSASIKHELAEAFGIDEQKIYITGNKINPDLLSVKPVPPVDASIKTGDYFLMVGSQDPRKNFALAEQVFRDRFPHYKLVIAGGKSNTFNSTSSRETGDNIIHTGYTELATLAWLYRNAVGFINPSLYEGFGIPNLEALALGCPVICSGLEVFREVCGEAAWYFDPLLSASLENIIALMLQNKQMTAEKTSSGKVIFTSFQNKNRSPILLQALTL